MLPRVIQPPGERRKRRSGHAHQVGPVIQRLGTWEPGLQPLAELASPQGRKERTPKKSGVGREQLGTKRFTSPPHRPRSSFRVASSDSLPTRDDRIRRAVFFGGRGR